MTKVLTIKRNKADVYCNLTLILFQMFPVLRLFLGFLLTLMLRSLLLTMLDQVKISKPGCWVYKWIWPAHLRILMVTKKLEDVHTKLISGRKQHFWAQKGLLWAIGAEKRPQDMGDLRREARTFNWKACEPRGAGESTGTHNYQFLLFGVSGWVNNWMHR